MADKPCFVQFPHPGTEHNSKSGCVWNKLKNVHRRKFMQLRGDWIDRDGSTHTGGLRAWGEWEPESKLICKFSNKVTGPHHPKFLWEPYWIQKPSYSGLHNTDPFIFGDCFLYSNCGQTAEKKRGLKHLSRGSVIAFGSGKKIDGERKWMLDTVLVVRDYLDYGMREARTVLKDWAPCTFLQVVGGPLIDNEHKNCNPKPRVACAPTGTQLRLYQGATPDNRINGMFSFFPAMPDGGNASFPRPVVDLPNRYFNPSNWQAPKGHGSELELEDVRGLWDKLVAQVRCAGLVLGTRAALPERRPGSTF